MAFSKGDKVKAKADINGGILKPNVSKGQHGVVTKTHMLSSGVDVQFMKGGWGEVEVELTYVDEGLLERRW